MRREDSLADVGESFIISSSVSTTVQVAVAAHVNVPEIPPYAPVNCLYTFCSFRLLVVPWPASSTNVTVPGVRGVWHWSSGVVISSVLKLPRRGRLNIRVDSCLLRCRKAFDATATTLQCLTGPSVNVVICINRLL